VTWKRIVVGVLVIMAIIAIIIGVLSATGGGHSRRKGTAAIPLTRAR
jgi:TRAP-type uncharacterized transport system fused permease subunit